MADGLYKVLHYLDILKCSHFGKVGLFQTVERHAEIHKALRIVTEDDIKTVPIDCPEGCKRVTQIEAGWAKDVKLKGKIVMLGNLRAKTNAGGIVTWDGSLKAQISHEELRCPKAYNDSKGIPTIGIGHNIHSKAAQDRLKDMGYDIKKLLAGRQSLSEDDIDTLFDEDKAGAETTARGDFTNPAKDAHVDNPLGYDDLSPERQNAMLDLTFNMGSLLDDPDPKKRWPKFMTAMKQGNFNEAADQLGLDGNGKSPSQWVTDVKLERATRIMDQIRGGREAFAAPRE
jgi:GH24 family phage-related lysozyme (muramidase)